MKMTKKTESQIRAALPKFQKVLSDAKKQDFNESNTVDIITDILSAVFGYEKYSEILERQKKEALEIKLS